MAAACFNLVFNNSFTDSLVSVRIDIAELYGSASYHSAAILTGIGISFAIHLLAGFSIIVGQGAFFSYLNFMCSVERLDRVSRVILLYKIIAVGADEVALVACAGFVIEIYNTFVGGNLRNMSCLSCGFERYFLIIFIKYSSFLGDSNELRGIFVTGIECCKHVIDFLSTLASLCTSKSGVVSTLCCFRCTGNINGIAAVLADCITPALSVAGRLLIYVEVNTNMAGISIKSVTASKAASANCFAALGAVVDGEAVS